MNQKNIFFALVAFSSLITAAQAQQGDFNGFTANTSSWNTPTTNHSAQTANFQSTIPEVNTRRTFPASPVAFDPAIQNASYDRDQSVQPNAVAQGSFESKIDSAAESLSNWKDDISKKSSEIMGSFGSEGSLSDKFTSIFGGADLGRMLGSLSLVLGGYFALVWVMRKLNVGGNRGLPSEVLEVVGHAPFGPKQNLQLVRLGSKLLLLMNGPDGTQPIGEITDPVEVEHLVSLCTNKRGSAARPSISYSRPEVPRLQSPPPQREQQSTSLTDVLRALDNAKSNGTLFEA